MVTGAEVSFSSPEIPLVMRTLLYATKLNPLSVREPVSTKLNYEVRRTSLSSCK